MFLTQGKKIFRSEFFDRYIKLTDAVVLAEITAQITGIGTDRKDHLTGVIVI
jgi:hypothetical protein